MNANDRCGLFYGAVVRSKLSIIMRALSMGLCMHCGCWRRVTLDFAKLWSVSV